MKKQPIPGRTNSEGIFTADNPYNDNTITGSFQSDMLVSLYPPLPCYDNSNNLVKDADVVVTGPVYQGRVFRNQDWELISKEEFDNFAYNKFLQVRRAYLCQ